MSIIIIKIYIPEHLSAYSGQLTLLFVLEAFLSSVTVNVQINSAQQYCGQYSMIVQVYTI